MNGLGASAILKAVVKRLRTSSSPGHATRAPAGLDKIIHIDCSLWQSRRALQKAIAEELELPSQVMAIFNQYDEEEDFNGVEQGTRGVIPQVTWAVLDKLHNSRFLMVLHNGSGSYIDLREYGILIAGHLGKRVLWTSRGRFRLHGIQDNDMKKLAGLSDATMSLQYPVAPADMMWCLLLAEAEEVAIYTGILEPTITPQIILKCIMYRVLRCDDYGIDWRTHAPIYWVCDEIIQASPNGDSSQWTTISEALHKNMCMDDWDRYWMVNVPILIQSYEKNWSGSDCWVSANSQKVVQVPPHATSLFVTPRIHNKNATMVLKDSMFGHSNMRRLRVVHLSQCSFSFSCPPFLSCSNLRFLLLDHCENKDAATGGDCNGEVENQHSGSGHYHGSCFGKLWVLEIIYTRWYWLLSEEMMDVMVELRELNVQGLNNCRMSHVWSRNNGSRHNSSLLKIRVTAEIMDIDPTHDINQVSTVEAFLDLSRWCILKTVILNGCNEFEKIDPSALPPSLESFSFTSNVDVKIKSISFRGCAKLNSLFLKGLFGSLLELDMSGTSVKTLDLSVAQTPRLKRLFLLGSEKLCAILWPQEGKKPKLYELHIDTMQATLPKEYSSHKQEATSDDTCVGPASATMFNTSQGPSDLLLCVILSDSRLLRSLVHVNLYHSLHIEISSAANYAIAAGRHIGTGQGIKSGVGRNIHQVLLVNEEKLSCNLYGDEVAALFKHNLQAGGANRNSVDGGNAQEIMWMWPCPSIPLDEHGVYGYISIKDARTNLLQDTSTIETRSTTLPDFVHDNAKTLHIHDNFSITGIPGPASDAVALRWYSLKWCRLERCPNIKDAVYTAPLPGRVLRSNTTLFCELSTFWASQLINARYIWNWDTSSFHPYYYSFMYLVFLHVDCCPRLIHVLPLCSSNRNGCGMLQTLEIVCCDNLIDIFPLNSVYQEPVTFPSLKRVHLHELPKLQRICGRRMSAPNLKTVKIRGCWSLMFLPAVRHSSGDSTPPKVNCEKEWWDGLEWDGLEANHHPSLYEASHSAYYKKTRLRASVLR